MVPQGPLGLGTLSLYPLRCLGSLSSAGHAAHSLDTHRPTRWAHTGPLVGHTQAAASSLQEQRCLHGHTCNCSCSVALSHPRTNVCAHALTHKRARRHACAQGGPHHEEYTNTHRHARMRTT